MSSSIRSFIAAELPVSLKRALAKVVQRLAKQWPEYRWVDSEQLHLTLNFLGEVPDEKIPQVCQIIRNTLADREGFTFRVNQLGAFPKISRPRIVWAGIDEGSANLSRIFYDLRDALDELRLDRDRKAYRPHITLGRIRNNERWPDSMIEHLTNATDLQIDSADVDQIALYSSFSDNQGSSYTVMDRVDLMR